MVDTTRSFDPSLGPTAAAALADDDLDLGPPPPLKQRVWQYAKRHPTVMIGFAILVAMALISIAAPLLASDPLELNPIIRLKPPSAEF
ncbi:MAG: hypothetical protein QF754_06230, partial [Alphaproteobacteria bacterium]|nr:hypothetical protein [Alphaproteobacteria bacterium]